MHRLLLTSPFYRCKPQATLSGVLNYPVPTTKTPLIEIGTQIPCLLPLEKNELMSSKTHETNSFVLRYHAYCGMLTPFLTYSKYRYKYRTAPKG